MLQSNEYIPIPIRTERLLFFTHPYRATWPRGLSAGSGRPCTTRAGPASSRGFKSSWKRNIRFMSQHPTYDTLYMLAFTTCQCVYEYMYPVVELHSRVENFVYHIPKTRQHDHREKNTVEKTRFHPSTDVHMKTYAQSNLQLNFTCKLARHWHVH